MSKAQKIILGSSIVAISILVGIFIGTRYGFMLDGRYSSALVAKSCPRGYHSVIVNLNPTPMCICEDANGNTYGSEFKCSGNHLPLR